MSAPLCIIAETFGSKTQARAVLHAIHKAGYVCVPREPTAKMVEDGWASANEENAAKTWQAMVLSALTTQAEGTQEE